MTRRTIAIGDVHGEATLLVALLRAVDPQGDDELVFLGDLVDRGLESRQVLDRTIELSQQFAVTYLRGNHEAMLLGAREDKQCFSWLRHGGLQTIASYAPEVADVCTTMMDELFAHRLFFPIEPFLSAVPDEHWTIIEQSTLFERRAGHILCHAGVDATRTDVENTRPGILLGGHKAFPEEYTGTETVVFGHWFSGDLRGDDQPLPYVSERGNAIGIDTGVHRTGTLTARCLEEGRYYSVDPQTSQVRQFTTVV